MFSTIGTRVSCFKRALLYTNSATLLWMVENIFLCTFEEEKKKDTPEVEETYKLKKNIEY